MALLPDSDLKPTTHNRAKSNFSEYFIKTAKIDSKYGKMYSQLFTLRQKGDYDDLYDFDKGFKNNAGTLFLYKFIPNTFQRTPPSFVARIHLPVLRYPWNEATMGTDNIRKVLPENPA